MTPEEEEEIVGDLRAHMHRYKDECPYSHIFWGLIRSMGCILSYDPSKKLWETYTPYENPYNRDFRDPEDTEAFSRLPLSIQGLLGDTSRVAMCALLKKHHRDLQEAPPESTVWDFISETL